jgi:hypothetical protein
VPPTQAMTSVYISSTRTDLKKHIRSVAETLERCGYAVEAMEKYHARDDRPKDACEADAAKCDIYVGIFAWRYGYVPVRDNPKRKSITELEYLAAAKKLRLIFLLAENVRWPSSLQDAKHMKDKGKRIRALRNRLKKEHWTGFFKSPDDLAKQVLTTIVQIESTKRVGSMDAIQEEVQKAAEFGPSFLTNLQQRFAELSSTEFIALRLGPTVWWNTRLHLASALAADFTEIRQFLILDAAKRVLLVTSPLEIRRALTKSQPKLEMAYLQCRAQAQPPFPTSEVDSVISAYPNALSSVFAGQQENAIKEVVTPTSLRELGIKQQGEALERPVNRPFSYAEIMQPRERYVVLVRDGEVDGVIDRVELASRMASDEVRV